VDDEVVERRAGVVPQRLENAAERAAGDPRGEQLVEERIAAEEQGQTKGEEEKRDAGDDE
jgi:hypothetical protein